MKHEPLPEGWLWVRFDEIAYNLVERNGDNPNRTVMAVTKYDGLVPSLEYFDRQVFSDDISKYKVVRPNQFAYAVIHLDEGSIGMNDTDEPVLVSPVYIVFGLDERKADPEYFRFLLKSDYMMMTYQRIGEGTVDRRKSITFETLGSAHILLPPIDEQHRITEILRDTDVNIARVEAQVEAAQEVKRGVIEYIYNPLSKYEKKCLAELVDPERPIVYGILMPGKGHHDGIPVIKVKDLVDGHIQTDDLLLTSPEIDAQFSRSKLKSGDLLFSIRGTVGRKAFVPPELDGANITQDTARISLVHADAIFIYNYLETRTIRNYLDLHTIGQAVKGINLSEVRRISFHLPPLVEQRKIAAILSAHDATIRNLQVEAESLREVKRGLMQKLLSGEVRV